MSASRIKTLFFFPVLISASLLLSAAASAQTSYTAQIRGTVTDQSGAVIQNATVTIINVGTNISTSSKTDAKGLFLLPGLRPDRYIIRADAPGFRAQEKTDVVLQVDQQATVSFTLAPAGVITTVEVTQALPLLDTESANLGTDVANEYVRDIPLYNRSVFGLVFLAGGVTETAGAGVQDNYPSGTNFVSNGQRNATAEVRLDGSPISAPEQGEGGNSNVYYQPSVEIVQEFKLQNNSFSAEFGNNGGTVLNVVLKQGTNSFHGSGWWYGQRAAFDSRDFFNRDEKPDHTRDQYGFSLGGPIIRNKTFFFVDFEKVREKDPVNLEGYVPTVAERSGNFSQAGTPIFDPTHCVPQGGSCVRPEFSYNGVSDVIPPTEIDPIGQAMLNLYPLPNITNVVSPDSPNFRKVILATDPGWQFDVKIDHQITSQQKIGGRYSRHHDVFTSPTVLGNGDLNDGFIGPTTVQNGGLEYNWMLAPTKLLTARIGVDRAFAPVRANHYPTLQSVGLPSILAANGLNRMPAILTDTDQEISLFSQCCVDTNFAHTLYSYSSMLQWINGRHSLKFGGEQRLFYNNFFQPNYPTGDFTFSRDVTASQPNAGLGDNGEGNSYATILTGFAYSGELNIIPAVADKSKETAFFVQDDWKVNSKLTVNFGLRYEWSTPYSERFNRIQFSDFKSGTGITIPVDRDQSGGQLPPALTQQLGQIGTLFGTTVFPSSGRHNSGVDRNNFAPRLGFAYQLAPNTVLRGGAGVFYGMSVATNFQFSGTAFRKSAVIHFTKDNFQSQFASLADPFPPPAGLTSPQGTKYGKLAEWGFDNGNDVDTGTARNAEIYQWNLGLQHLLPGGIVIAADYSANRSTHLPWAGTNSTRNRNFLPSSIRNALVENFNPGHDPNDNQVSDLLNTTVPNPFQCFFTTVGSPASYCPASPNFNEADSIYNDAQIPELNLLRPYPQFDGTFQGLPLLEASSWYHSLQIRFQKRASHYISFEGNYTLSKATDYSSTGANGWVGNLYIDNPQVLDHLKAEHGIGANDATHRFTLAFILDLPVGNGRWIGNHMNRVADGIVGGWSLYSFATLQSGQPLGIPMASPRLADGNQRPNVICSQLRTGLTFTEAAISGQPYLNPDCFADPGDNIPGNAPRFFSNLRGPGVRNLDLSLSKEFTIREGKKLQIRAEMFNATNTPRFAIPNTFWDGPSGSGGSFGTITNTPNFGPGTFRRMQFGARFQF
jgi:Carboxypeptidase regulatory-like domain/TonB dependent receptor-like, beta-barrel